MMCSTRTSVSVPAGAATTERSPAGAPPMPLLLLSMLHSRPLPHSFSCARRCRCLYSSLPLPRSKDLPLPGTHLCFELLHLLR